MTSNYIICESNPNYMSMSAQRDTDVSHQVRSETETHNRSCCSKLQQWFLESGDPEDKLPPRWKRAVILTGTCSATVGLRAVTTDSVANVTAAIFSSELVQTELYNLSHKHQALVLAGMTGLSYLARYYLFPTSLVVSSFPGLCWGLLFKVASFELQKWANIRAARNSK